MSDDAQPPVAPGHDDTPRPAPPRSDAPRDPWAPPEPARESKADASKVSFEKPVPGEPADPAPLGTPAGPGDTLASGSGPVPPSVHDQQTITSLPAAGGGEVSSQWAAPTAPPSPGPPPGGLGDPFAPPAPPGPRPRGGAVPPPPIAPHGPGQMPYGYPGGYGYPPPAAGGGYYGWPGMPPDGANGMGTAGLVLGILAAIVFCLWPLAIILGILGVIFGAIGRGKAKRGQATNGGQALAGIICGAAGIVLGITTGVLVIVVR
ncbi:DUF4190 domain-containing protein [Streptomyces sp.]|uniref:DUF4190 domain-containing protein n=1 Tax=Streptomyces sp. TaxID=1931 RepID=UPI002D5F5654|nr:hypothetical protein [Streptomyces sp.]HZF92405.1 hypothetical protein [Streptomyces sp.]